MIVLGISPNHDSSLCVVKDGEIVSAISRERLSRVKKDRYITQYMMDYVLDEAGITIDDVDYVGITYWFENRTDWKNDFEDLRLYIQEDYMWMFDKRFDTNDNSNILRTDPYYVEGKGYEMLEDLVLLTPPITTRPFENVPINLDVYGRTIPGWFINHHHAHAASTYYTTNLGRSAIFTMDSTEADPYACSLFSYGYGNKLETLYYPGVNIAHTYSVFTELMGLGPGLYKAGTTMGLAPYGKVNPDIIKDIDKYTKSYWERTEGGDDWRWIYRLFMKTTGKVVTNPQPGEPMMSDNFFDVEYFNKETSDSQEAMDAAATIQYIFEQTVFRFANELYEETKTFNGGNICLAGGGFLNCTTNGKIEANTPFTTVSPYPGSGDDGLSVGCALYVSHNILDVPRTYKTVGEVIYTGREYETPEGGMDLDFDVLGRKLNEGKVIAWVQGGSEFGPRALGHRSFIANPCLEDMRDYINFEIKNREWFRPFAPAVCIEDVEDYFDFEGESPYMLKICDVVSDRIPSVTHVDGTARIQTVKREDNPRYYDLIRSFEKYSGVPVILNTSLNLAGEPIVETPEDAFNLYDGCDVDILVINDKMWIK